MNLFDWVAAAIVILSLIHISFVLTLTEWFAALRKGQAVTLLPERAGRKWPLWTQVLLMVVGLALCVPLFYYLWIPLVSLPATAAQILGVLGLILYLLGMALILWARRTLGKNWGLSTSTQVKLRDDHQLVQTGPYAFIRHPMYFGWWVCLLGLVLLYPKWVIALFLLFSLISFYGRARREEAALAESFGPVWTEHKKRTRFIIPFIY